MLTVLGAYSWVNIRFLLEGAWVTILVSVCSIVLSYIFGVILGIVRYVKIKYLSAIVGFIIDIIRNLPLILIIFFTYFGLPHLGFKPDPIWASVIAWRSLKQRWLLKLFEQESRRFRLVKWKGPGPMA
ncbi:glutamate transport membrane-spanning protein [Lentilactobacillus farraginis DSM 18382 = JCM 14108]|uniref:Glutamate transport membrane-spanning protein n=1 Tax=Lentilactobacillus farraginis DSM 18382 = JCM 14108 TaxID=1423743 RepID=X0PKG7_9LACO|nr:glutamate transport membrane-spanning protein [Lentilactobacillus farraginis DSM 18382 = JCM 14108]